MLYEGDIYHIKCPECSNKLSRVSIGNVSIDVCQGGCAGIWFDKDEINKIENCKSETDILFRLKKNNNIIIDGNKEKNCPVCADTKLIKHDLKDNFSLRIDECGKCGGIWLDAGEIELLLNYKPEKHTGIQKKTGDELRKLLAKNYNNENLSNSEILRKASLIHGFVNAVKKD